MASEDARADRQRSTVRARSIDPIRSRSVEMSVDVVVLDDRSRAIDRSRSSTSTSTREEWNTNASNDGRVDDGRVDALASGRDSTLHDRISISNSIDRVFRNEKINLVFHSTRMNSRTRDRGWSSDGRSVGRPRSPGERLTGGTNDSCVRARSPRSRSIAFYSCIRVRSRAFVDDDHRCVDVDVDVDERARARGGARADARPTSLTALTDRPTSLTETDRPTHCLFIRSIDRRTRPR